MGNAQPGGTVSEARYPARVVPMVARMARDPARERAAKHLGKTFKAIERESEQAMALLEEAEQGDKPAE